MSNRSDVYRAPGFTLNLYRKDELRLAEFLRVQTSTNRAAEWIRMACLLALQSEQGYRPKTDGRSSDGVPDIGDGL